MEINFINKELFKEYLNKLKAYRDYIDKLNDVGVRIWERSEIGNFETSFVHMLSLLCHEEWGTRYGNNIEYFIWECEFGKDESIVSRVEGDDQLIFFHNADELWDYLVSIHPELEDKSGSEL